MQETTTQITFFYFFTIFLVLFLSVFILVIVLLYRKKQIAYQNEMERLKSEFEKNLLSTQLEIKEQIFQNISQEIHDHICLNLTLAKLNLVTLNTESSKYFSEKISSSIDIIGQSIQELSDISHSMNPEIIESHGLIKALELELKKIKKVGLFNTDFILSGNTVFMNSQKELVIYRIIQESFNNIIKHAKAKNVLLKLHYSHSSLNTIIKDDGKGFVLGQTLKKDLSIQQSGLTNMKKRASLINGSLYVSTEPGKGTTINLTIPY